LTVGRPAFSQRSQYAQQAQSATGTFGEPYLVAHCKTVRLAEEGRTLDPGWVAANHPGYHCMVLEMEEPAHGHNWVEEKVVIVGVDSLRNLEVCSWLS